MRTLYLECAMGAAGDMLMAALYELLPEKEAFLAKMNSLIPGVEVLAEPAVRQGIAGTHMRVVIRGQEEGHHHDHTHDHTHHHHHHEHRSLEDIRSVIDGFDLPEQVRERAKVAYWFIAGAESRAHGVTVEQVHFHEVGALDAVIDVTGVCYLMHLLAPDGVAVSPVTVGSGTVRTAHGLLPVPAPATAYLLEGMPVTSGDIAAELCTPTGAVLLKLFANSFGPLPAGRLLSTGCGCGTKDFPRANCLRAFLVEQADRQAERLQGPNDTVVELKANIDDMTAEDLGFAMDRLLEAGALDVSWQAIHMKKNRPGVLLLCLCREEDADRLAVEILRHTATFGVRRTDCARYALSVDRSAAPLTTGYGTIRCKAGSGYGICRGKPEYEDLAAAALDHGVPISAVRAAYENNR